MPLGRIKIINDSSAGGNNGVKSIIEHLKTQKFIRIKIGTWSELKEKMEAQDFVLSKFTAAEKKTIKELSPKIGQAIVDLVEAYPAISKVQNVYNERG
jgi:PTH1 family peptidyl-tRNA hydrolase